MENELILLREYCENTQVEHSFVLLLESEGLIELEIRDNVHYIRDAQLGDIETFARLYYDLSVNIEGIDIINNLLQKLRKMEEELFVLKKQLDDDSYLPFEDVF